MNRNLFLYTLIFVSFLGIPKISFSQSADSSNKTIGNEKKIEEWKDNRFGMFIHWGPVSLKGTEIGWSRGREIPIAEYDNLYKQFNPVNFNADEWVSVAKAAGMKYIVLTTKHHDGFCLWNTRETDYNIMNTPFGRDVVKELSNACKKAGIDFGTYYSSCDWYHPAFPLGSPGGKTKKPSPDLAAYDQYLRKQLTELIINYGPLLTIWFDVPQVYSAEYGIPMVNMLHNLQPDILINNRAYSEPGRTSGYAHQHTVGDYETPEQQIGSFQIDRPWETCMTIASQWAWKPDDKVKSLEQCLQSLVRSAGGDGNLLFNVGPKPDGSIEPLQIERLKEMGQWLQKYGYSIYGKRGGPFKPTDWGVSTRKGNTIYLHILNWFGNSPKIVLPDIGMEIKSCKLTDGSPVKLTKQGTNMVIEFSGKALQPINTIIEIEVKGNAMDIQPMEIGSQSLSYNKKVTASSNPNPKWKDISSINNGDWVGHAWSPDKEDKAPWAEIDLGKPQKISKAIIYESGQSVNSFELQYLSGEKWKTIYKGKSIGEKAEIKLPKTTAQKVRLVLADFSEVPGIYEIVLL